MALIGNLILRLIVVTIGYGLACAAAGAFLAFGLFNEPIAHFFEGFEHSEGIQTGSLVAFSIGLSFLISWLSFMPTVIGIAIAEAMRWQGMVTNLVLGGVVAFVVGVLQIPRDELSGTSEGTLIVLLATGFIAGFVYWVIAGHSAGRWLGEPRDTEETAETP